MKPSLPPAPPPTWDDLGPPPPAYQHLLDSLGQTGWLCHGTVVCRPLWRRSGGRRVKKGPYYLWTCKTKGRTRCLALSQAQYHLLARAISNNRRLQTTLDRLRAITLKTILKKVPGTRKRK